MAPKAFIVLRGIPGAGKTTLAETLRDYCSTYYSATRVAICSNDHYWERTGTRFSISRLQHAIAHCASEIRQASAAGAEIIVLDNNNLAESHYRRFINMAENAKYCWDADFEGYKVFIVDLQCRDEDAAYECAYRNTHDIDEEYVVEKFYYDHDELSHNEHQAVLRAPLEGEGQGMTPILRWLAEQRVLPSDAAEGLEDDIESESEWSSLWGSEKNSDEDSEEGSEGGSEAGEGGYKSESGSEDSGEGDRESEGEGDGADSIPEDSEDSGAEFVVKRQREQEREGGAKRRRIWRDL